MVAHVSSIPLAGRPLSLATAALALAFCVSASDLRIAAQAPSPAVAALHVHASLQSGPGGDSWDLTLTAAGAAHAREETTQRLTPPFRAFLLAYTNVRGLSSGTVMGEFTMQPDYVARVHEAIEVESFFDLPPSLNSGAGYLHQPDLSLEIGRGARWHTVRLYDPARLTNDSRAQRFLRVWTTLYQGLPMRPSWPED